MDFGFTLKPDHTIERTIALTRQAEAGRLRLRLAVRLACAVADPYPLLTVMALNTSACAWAPA